MKFQYKRSGRGNSVEPDEPLLSVAAKLAWFGSQKEAKTDA